MLSKKFEHAGMFEETKEIHRNILLAYASSAMQKQELAKAFLDKEGGRQIKAIFFNYSSYFY